MNPLQRLQALGQSPWLDYIQRDMLKDGKLQAMIRDDAISGVTSNPSIFAKSILTHDDYQEAITLLQPQCATQEALYEKLVLEDIRMAADQLLPVYEASGKIDGYVSLEVSPDLAYDSVTTVSEALRLWRAIDRPNAMIKVPATQPGLDAIRELTSHGININATLIFSPARYKAVAMAWRDGLAERMERGEPIDHIASVASFFVSRIESLADKLLTEKGSDLQGKVAVATAKSAYRIFERLQREPEATQLAAKGAMVQRLLWASTSTKNAAYSDIKYVEELVAPNTVNTLPPATMEAYLDHGHPEVRIESDLDAALTVLDKLKDLGIEFEAMAAQLEEEGIRKFQDAYEQLLEALASV